MKTIVRLIVFSLFGAAGLMAHANVFRVTPYVQHPATNAMSILFLSDANVSATVRWWPQGDESKAQSAVITPREATELQYYGDSHAKQYLPEMIPFQYRYRITGLQPDSVYAYSVQLADGPTYSRTFRTVPAQNRAVRFVCYSDCETQPSSNGDCVTWDDYAVDKDTNPGANSRKYYVDQTVGYASNICTMVARNPEFFVVAGDLAQAGSCQTHWDEFWRHNAGKLNDPAGSIPIMAALGNHEYASYDAQWGEQGAKKFLSYFEFETNGTSVATDQQERFHRFDYGPVALIFIDPNNGPDNEPPSGTPWSWAWEYSNPHPLDTNSQLYHNRIDGGVDKSSRVPQFQPGSVQYQWLEEQLADAQTNKLFTFLICHQCPFSAGYHGRASGEIGRGTEGENLSGQPTRCLTNLVFKYGVDAWICGHDEMYEHSQVKGEETLKDGTKRPITVNVYDVGIGGDGLRGCRIKQDPNEFEVFRAHVDAPEVYDDNGTLISGGKHYGHLEVNVATNKEGYWTATLSPVYNFVSTNKLTGKLTFERRVYADEIVVTNLDVKPVTPTPSFTTRTWTGGAGDGKASTAGNWSPEGVPVTGEAVAFTSGSDAIAWDAGMAGVKLAGWTQDGYTGTITFATVFDEAGFYCVEIAGDVILNTGTWTHKSNGSSRTNRLYVKCDGNFTIGPDATVSADGLGYYWQINSSLYGLGWSTGTQGGSYGGHGGMATANTNCTYGCYYAPEDLGNAGCWNMGDLTGAGALRLDVAGALTHNGTLTACSTVVCKGGDNYSGAGGSIYVRAGSITGTGTMRSCSRNTGRSGSGGRIAIILTQEGSTFSQYDVLNRCTANSSRADMYAGGCGTIYAETPADTPHEGWLILKGNGTEPSDKRLCYADPFTYQYKSLHFARLTVTNATLLRIGGGYTLNLENTVCEMKTGGIAIDGGTVTGLGDTWNVDYPVRYWSGGTTPNISIAKGTTFKVESPAKTLPIGISVAGTLQLGATMTFGGSLTVSSGGVLTTPSWYSMYLTVNGDMTIAEGAKAHVDGRGYGIGSNPRNTGLENGDGGSHAGWSCGYYTKGTGSQRGCKPWGSIKNPVHSGGGGSNNQHGTVGGGVLKLTVGGKLTVDGTISSNAGDNTYPGAGGSLNISAGSFVGATTGKLLANAGSANAAASAGGGGRIAVRLTGNGSTFSDYAGVFQAYGSVNGGNVCGGAGTIWLKTADQSEDEGTLIIANKTTTRAYEGATPLCIDEWNSDLNFGTVIIGEKAKVTLADDATMTVRGSWVNTGKFVAGSGSTVAFAGTADAVVTGATTFASIACSAPGKRITFAEGASITATTLASFAGDKDNHLTLVGADGKSWSLVTTGAAASMSDVEIGGCQSTEDLTVQGGKDLGGNSANVKVVVVEPKTLTWTGAVDSNWSTAGNWSANEGEGRAPLSIDTVIIPAAGRNPTLVAAANCLALTVQAGATLDLSDKDISIANDLLVVGSLVASGSQTITVGGEVSIPGDFTRATSTFLLNGTAAQTFASAASVYGLTIATPQVTIGGNLVCDSFTSVAEDVRKIYFADGASLKANTFTVKGVKDTALTRLEPLSEGQTWPLFVYASDVEAVVVKGSDASAGLPIIPAYSSGTDCTNWYFEDTRTVWDGTTALEAGTDLVVAENVTGTISADIALNSIELREGAKLTISASVPVTRNVLAGKNTTLTWNRPATIGGQLVVLDGAVMTHTANGSTEANKINLTVTGGGYIAPTGKINTNEKGYGAGMGPGSGKSGGSYNSGTSYGGRGSYGNQMTSCYGSFLCPTNCGSGACHTDGTPNYVNGGGAVILKFGGVFSMEGTITANGGCNGTHYGSSGGSVYITTASITGSGTIQARGGYNGNGSGGGGRVAIVLTGAGSDFSEFIGSVDAYGGTSGTVVYGAPGTVYLKTPADNGTVTVAKNSSSTHTTTYDSISKTYVQNDFTDFPATKQNDDLATMGLVNLVIGDFGPFVLNADMTVGTLRMTGTSPQLFLNGHTLRVREYRPRKWWPRTGFPAGVTASGGKVVWMNRGTYLFVK